MGILRMGSGASVNMKSQDEFIAKTKAFLGSREKCDEVWKVLDFNGNGVVSVAETCKFLLDSQDSWDGFFKPPINKTSPSSSEPGRRPLDANSALMTTASSTSTSSECTCVFSSSSTTCSTFSKRSTP